MVEATTVRKLLDTIELRLGRLRQLSHSSLDEYVRDVSLQDQVERNFEVCIRACIDLGAHIFADFPKVQPDTYADVFRLLADERIITVALSVYAAAPHARNWTITHNPSAKYACGAASW